VVRTLRPDVILNTAAFHNVPRCEEDPLRSFQVNALGALHLGREANAVGALSVYYSTDYVFDGKQRVPYCETDRPAPLNVYAATKLSGEFFTLHYAHRPLVLRVSGIYGRVPCRAKGGNFITTMIRVARERPEVRVVEDEILCPTPTTAIAAATLNLIEGGATGLFHTVSEGQCSWFEFARVIFDTLRLRTPLLPSRSEGSPSPVQRPMFSALRNARLAAEGFPPLPHWKDGLVSFLRSAYPESAS
jgi:dTDP-4-dehydrorhamnose reductase